MVIERSKSLVVVLFRCYIYLAGLCQDFGNQRLCDHLYIFLLTSYLKRSSRLVNQVDGLVWQETVIDIFRAGLYGIAQGLVFIDHLVELFIPGAQLHQDVHGFVDAGLQDVYLLETAYQSFGTREVLVVFFVSC